MTLLNFYLLSGSFLLSWFLYKKNIPILKKVLVDRPVKRSSHEIIKPTGGGIIFILVFNILNYLILLLGVKNIYLFLPILCLPLAITGFIDDFKELKNNVRFLFQLIISIFLVNFSNLINLDNNFIIFSILVIIATSFINFSNFMDGIDGLLAGCMLIAFGTAAITQEDFFSLWLLIGSLLGFFIWNWNPSSVFMGDTGSTYLGALYLGFVLNSDNYLEAIGLFLVTGPLFLDSISCLFRRFINRENIFKAHNKHTYQRLYQAGFNHSQVSSLYIIGTFFISLFFLIGGIKAALLIVLIEFILGLFIDKKLAVPFNG